MNVKAILSNILKNICEKMGFVLCESGKPYLPWPTVFSTVDVAVVDPVANCILLGKKRASGNWVIFGGFTEPNSSSNAEDAVRETWEESGIVALAETLQYIGDFNVRDGRYEHTPHGVRTNLYILPVNMMDVTTGPEAPNDPEIETTEWFSLKEDLSGRTASKFIQKNHQYLLTAVKNQLGV